MVKDTKALTFAAVDEVAFAASRGLLNTNQSLPHYTPKTLGPLLELLMLTKSGCLPPWVMETLLVPNGAAPMIKALIQQQERWLAPVPRMGFIRAKRSYVNGSEHFTDFLMKAQRAASDIAELPGHSPGHLTAAMKELESNIHEHSEASDTGVLAFRATKGMFEFVAGDCGIGSLNSLKKSATFSDLSDHGLALETALAEGASRFGFDSQRGYGFRPMFLGLVNLNGSLRFRSGDYSLTMDGTSPSLTTKQLAQKPMMKGFFASVQCLG